ncbi:toll/interleukin-1 receptor domain-containing protein [Pseudovibrio ascidiaceicola]|uniref:toll/interleukin-1 receptor domain-containing protein n=1 Tax=Pseudovibrio ascidiaceicola TaxID=285279 RepID=UPI000D68AA00|nr:toll/interleukin-1 receptor domain-containing protein [Pseudovibrio ascidiaceicola]
MNETQPLLAIYIMWHSEFGDGETIATSIYEHFRSSMHSLITGGIGIDVQFRFKCIKETGKPKKIDLDASATTAIITLLDPNMAKDESWIEFLKDISVKASKAGYRHRLFPVSIETSTLQKAKLSEQAFRWDNWQEAIEGKIQRLIRELAYEMCRMLRLLLTELENPEADRNSLTGYLKKVEVFLSHSKHDAIGEDVAKEVRDFIHNGHGLSSFFDVNDIPAGLPFDQVILHSVKNSAMISIHTDTYSSREWCRKEVIEAKRHHVPLVVANCLVDTDQRAFPYIGNVPVIRLDPDEKHRIALVIGHLLDEVLKGFVWRCHVCIMKRKADQNTIFIPRTPELLSLATLPQPEGGQLIKIVHPDPPIAAEEKLLFDQIATHVQLFCLSDWIAEVSQ